MVRHGGVRLGAIVFSLLMSGCAASRTFQPEVDVFPFDEGALVCEQVNHRRPNIMSFRSLAESTVTAGNETISFRYVIVGRDPDQLRIDLLPTEGAFTLGMLVSRDGTTRVLNTQDKTFSESSDSSALIEQFLGLRGFSPTIIEALVTGIAPQFDCSDVRVYRERKGETIIYSVADRVAWVIADDSGRVNSFDVLSPDSDVVQVAGALYYSGNQTPASMSLSVVDPHEAHGVLLFKKVNLNTTIADEIFDVPVPPSFSRVDG